MKRLPNVWLNNQEITKSARGLGTVLTGETVAMQLTKALLIDVGCSNGHVMKLADSPESGLCPVCKKAGKRAALDPTGMLSSGTGLPRKAAYDEDDEKRKDEDGYSIGGGGGTPKKPGGSGYIAYQKDDDEDAQKALRAYARSHGMKFKDEDDDDDDDDAKTKRQRDPSEGSVAMEKSIDAIAKAVEERMSRRKTGGMLDGKPIYDVKRKSQTRIDSPRRTF